ncbi:hypothetical protein HALDL1_04240 [Halobacterium sp. DL1]|nr:hypothetical protein HALDL1_04240 [Halobacterium sp. DL1]
MVVVLAVREIWCFDAFENLVEVSTNLWGFFIVVFSYLGWFETSILEKAQPAVIRNPIDCRDTREPVISNSFSCGW